MNRFNPSVMVPERERREPGGIALVVVLVVMAAILLMALGVLAVTGVERKTARSFVDAAQAEWVARAGVEDVRALLREQTANDDYLIVAGEREREEGDRMPLDSLYLARGHGGGEDLSWSVFPLFSSSRGESTGTDLGALLDPASDGGGATLRTLPWAAEAKVTWLPVEDRSGRLVGRYAFWVEDLQGKVAVRADDAGAGRALHALDPGNPGDEDASTLDERLVEGMPRMVSPGSAVAAAGFAAPLERQPDGRLADPLAAAVEENVAPVVRSYREPPRVPFAEGIDAALAGRPKLNLNELLHEPRGRAIDDFAAQVEAGLPRFAERKGGFPDDYLRGLAANAFDYADADREASVKEGVYRGLDAYPLISEHLVRFRWEDIAVENGRKYVVLSASVYAEFWNMSDRSAAGEARVSFETNYGFDLGPVPDLNLGAFLDDPGVASPLLEKRDGCHWFPPLALKLEPNEYRLVRCGTVTFRIDAGPAPVWVSSPIELRGEDQGETGYRMEWNGVPVDASRGGVKHPDIVLHYPVDTLDEPRQGIWSTVPGHSYSVARFDYVNNMGDPRMAAYIGIGQDPNDYPDNYSPNRRTIRWGNVYATDSPTKPKVYGRVMPSEWPDGGHDTSFGALPAAVLAGKGRKRGDERINPDDPQFFSGLPPVEPAKAPTRLSNRGRFLSACELGRIYDPVMWVPTYDDAADTKTIRGGRLPSGRTRWPDVTVGSPPSDHYGGGNTLRIGRPEHPKFDEPGLRATHLLDLFHAGDAEADGARAGLVTIDGRINVNSATRDALRVMMVGLLRQDPALAQRLSESHVETGRMAPPTEPLELGTPANERAADLLADALIRGRPFAGAAELAAVRDGEDRPVFGNRELYDLNVRIEWDDAAAEEVFARLYDHSTLRSRNFRVWVVGQALSPGEGGGEPVVLAESRKVFTLFCDPGERDDEGRIDAANYRPRILYENDF